MAAKARSNGHATITGGGPVSGGSPSAAEDVDGTDEDSGEVDPSNALEELEDRGIVLRDLERGLVDFPSRHPNGRIVLLCWLSGEDDLGWWHLPEEGFAGRKPLPLPPDL